MDPKLLDILACPSRKGPLRHDRPESRLVCSAEALAYPIVDGIPHLLLQEAQPFDQETVDHGE